MESRVIKFRAWDKKNSHMFYPDDEPGEINFTRKIDGHRVGSDFNYNDLFDGCHDHLIPLQFSGLQDKNKRDIYEDDILIDTLTKMRYRVKFGRCKKFAYYGWYVENRGVAYETSINGDYDSPINSQIEIIGNAHETPELLT